MDEFSPHPGYQPAASSVNYNTSCKNSLALLRMGVIIARNFVVLIGIINEPLFLHLVGCLYYYIRNVQSYKYQRKYNTGW